jgi:hypothetical protein
MTFMAKVTIGPARVKLEDGRAEYMGDGMFVLLQKDQTERGGVRVGACEP